MRPRSGFRVQGVGFRASGLGFRVWDVGVKVLGCARRDAGFRCEVHGGLQAQAPLGI